MKRISAILVVLAMLIACLFTGASARADASVDCTIQVLQVVCVDAGVTVLNQPLALPTVKVTVPGPTIQLPAPPRVTRTVEVPGPRVTVTAPAAPQATRTIQVPGPTKTVTARPTAGPTRPPAPTQTITVPGLSSVTTVTPTPRQPQVTPGTLDPGSDGLIPREPTPIVVTGIGLGIIIVLAALILLGMYAGYYIGYRDSEKAEANFFRALLNKQ